MNRLRQYRILMLYVVSCVLSQGGIEDESLNTLIPSAVFVASPEPPKLPSLEEEFAVALNTEWENIEAKYFEDLESVFATLHQERAITRDEVVGTISNFVAHLSNRDDRQLIFNEFQEKYNRVAMADRRDKKVKPKLHQEVVKLEKTFQQLMDTRSKKCWELSEKSLIALLDSRVESLVDLFTTLIQTELFEQIFLKNNWYRCIGGFLLQFKRSKHGATGWIPRTRMAYQYFIAAT